MVSREDMRSSFGSKSFVFLLTAFLILDLAVRKLVPGAQSHVGIMSGDLASALAGRKER